MWSPVLIRRPASRSCARPPLPALLSSTKVVAVLLVPRVNKDGARNCSQVSDLNNLLV
uniref:Uncharacterized protein n=1 Tax=Arundo donax TaxID=35708 RepID=A0A0A9DXS8_ARUDO